MRESERGDEKSMETKTQTTETLERTATTLRERMRRAGVPVVRLANAAQVYPNDLYHILAGGPVGAVRRARINDAARQLGLMDQDEDE
jgi:hypothetical protein